MHCCANMQQSVTKDDGQILPSDQTHYATRCVVANSTKFFKYKYVLSQYMLQFWHFYSAIYAHRHGQNNLQSCRTSHTFTIFNLPSDKLDLIRSILYRFNRSLTLLYTTTTPLCLIYWWNEVPYCSIWTAYIDVLVLTNVGSQAAVVMPTAIGSSGTRICQHQETNPQRQLVGNRWLLCTFSGSERVQQVWVSIQGYYGQLWFSFGEGFKIYLSFGVRN